MVWLLNPIMSTRRSWFKGLRCHGTHVLHTDQRWPLQWRLATLLCHWNLRHQIWMDAVDKLTNLNVNQKAELIWVLQDNSKMFYRTLGIYSHWKIHIKLMSNEKPVHFATLIQFHACTYKPSNMNLIILLRSEIEFLQREVNMQKGWLCMPDHPFTPAQ